MSRDRKLIDKYEKILKDKSLESLEKLSLVELNFLLKLSKKWNSAFRYLDKKSRILLILLDPESEKYKSIAKKSINRNNKIKLTLTSGLLKYAKEKSAKSKAFKQALNNR